MKPGVHRRKKRFDATEAERAKRQKANEPRRSLTFTLLVSSGAKIA
jgi:hypothetical protein